MADSLSNTPIAADTINLIDKAENVIGLASYNADENFMINIGSKLCAIQFKAKCNYF